MCDWVLNAPLKYMLSEIKNQKLAQSQHQGYSKFTVDLKKL